MPPPPRICDLGGGPSHVQSTLERARALGFDHVAVDAKAAGALVPEAGDLGVIAIVDLTETDSDDPIVREHPQWFALRHAGHGSAGPIDPREPPQPAMALARYDQAPEAFAQLWSAKLEALARSGAAGVCLRHPQAIPGAVLKTLVSTIKAQAPQFLTIADIAGLARHELQALAGAGFDYCLSSLPWWDFRSPWLVEEYASASSAGRILSRIDAEGKLPPADCGERRTRLAVAAIAGSGFWMSLGFVDALEDEDCSGLERALRRMAALVASEPIIAAKGALRLGIDGGSGATVLLRTAACDMASAPQALLAFVNPDPSVAHDAHRLSFGDWQSGALLLGEGGEHLPPHAARLYRAERRKMVTTAAAKRAEEAAKEPRIVIADIRPFVEGGNFAVKRIVGDSVQVKADIFSDGHALLAAEVVYRAADEDNWRRIPMRALENDRWRAEFRLDRVGRHEFRIEAWIDTYGSFVRDLVRKRDAGRSISADLDEGRALLGEARVDPGWRDWSQDEKAAFLLAPSTIESVYRQETRAFAVRSAVSLIDADREAAAFSSWYELFPRSQTGDSCRHGRLADVVARLPAIRAMGFDVLYLPPIHPIGTTNRKGKNNALTADSGEPGSVYAIGSREGGHDAIHPELGTLKDFRALVAAARDHGMEIALDFAVQCSPDHPWLKQHPGWFDWRPDGSIKYAQNPPKVYEDIVNVDFYAGDAVPSLWNELRRIVLFWAQEGVRIFRVDNPHTKPFAFWQWLIESVRAENPDVLFLSEAFTRPKIMYRLAKLGFTQSYTYFTWRNTKAELTAYLRELNEPAIADFFRPHFFVNTPDINPYFLQSGGRPAFLIRAVLAATMSGLWGLYSGFELCEAEPLPGREEYLDSEKYEIKPRDWNAAGNIVAEIAALNRLRRAEPALQTHLGIAFYDAANPNILYYGKAAEHEDSRLLIAVNLNPHAPEAAEIELPLWEWGLSDHGALAAEDLLAGGRFVWHGKRQHLYLTPDAPYRIWKVRPAEDRP